MNELYKKLNEFKVHQIAWTIWHRKFKGSEQYIKVGIEMQGGDINTLKDILKKELEVINNKDIDEIMKFNPHEFNKAWKTNKWIDSCLEFFPGGITEQMYIGKFLSDYTDEFGNVDIDKARLDNEKSSFGHSEEKVIARGGERIKTTQNKESNLVQAPNLLQFCNRASMVYTCDESKSILIDFQFPVSMIKPTGIHLRMDSWKYKPENFIEDEAILNRQLKKIEEYKSKYKIPEDTEEFIKWLNSDVTIEEIEKYVLMYNSISIESDQYCKEVADKLKNSKLFEKYKDYTFYVTVCTSDSLAQNYNAETIPMKKVSFNYLEADFYKELYGEE